MIGDKHNKKGFTLIELIISVLIFTGIILSATQIFELTIKGQRNSIASQNVQENTKYFLEVISKEIRMAKRNNGVCSLLPGQIYQVIQETDGDALVFKNYYGDCVKYSIEKVNGIKRFKIERGTESGYISPNKINIDNLNFVVNNSGGASQQAAVTIKIKAHALNQGISESEMLIQTTLTSRYYK